jgi:phage gpG-like protein
VAVLIKAKGLRKAQKRFKTTAAQIKRGLLRAIEEAARTVENDVKKNKLRGGTPLNVRSGRLIKSTHTRIVKSRLAAFVGTPVPYAKAHEEGATIKPKAGGRVLTIPLPAAKTKSGMSRGSARQVASDYNYSFWHETEKGNLILFGVTANRQLVPLFLGVPKVTLPKREPFAKSERDTRNKVGRIINRQMTVAIERHHRA